MFATVSWVGGRMEIASGLSGQRFQTEDPDVIRIVHAFARPARIDQVMVDLVPDIEPHEVRRLVGRLIDARILVTGDEDQRHVAFGWEPSALAFHRRTRDPAIPGHPVRTTGAIAPSATATTLALERPRSLPSRPFADVLERRRSSRSPSGRAITCETLSALLWMSARNRRSTAAEPDVVDRPYPSGGAAYSLDIHLVLADGAVRSVPAGLYRYLPDTHRLESCPVPATDLRRFEAAACASTGSDRAPVVLVMTSRLLRQAEAYGELAYSLILKEVGGLFQTLYLVAEALDLGACAIGAGTPEALLARSRGIEVLAEPIVGEFLVVG
jgi:SagB-type dehydrogenase family enzyme